MAHSKYALQNLAALKLVLENEALNSASPGLSAGHFGRTATAAEIAAEEEFWANNRAESAALLARLPALGLTPDARGWAELEARAEIARAYAPGE